MLRLFFRGLFTAAFIYYLLPGALLHELMDHHHQCVVHLTPGKEDVVGAMHHHCELLQLAGPTFYPLTECWRSSTITLETRILYKDSPFFAFQTVEEHQLRGPPVKFS